MDLFVVPTISFRLLYVDCSSWAMTGGRSCVRHVLLSYMGYYKRHAHSPVIEQGRADIARRRKRGTHYLSSDPGRTAPSIGRM
jgi:hypothetical protein